MKARGVGRGESDDGRRLLSLSMPLPLPPTMIKRTKEGRAWPRGGPALPICERYLVDPASSHMLDSKTKPCMYKYMHFLLQNRGWLIKSVEVP